MEMLMPGRNFTASPIRSWFTKKSLFTVTARQLLTPSWLHWAVRLTSLLASSLNIVDSKARSIKVLLALTFFKTWSDILANVHAKRLSANFSCKGAPAMTTVKAHPHTMMFALLTRRCYNPPSNCLRRYVCYHLHRCKLLSLNQPLETSHLHPLFLLSFCYLSQAVERCKAQHLCRRYKLHRSHSPPIKLLPLLCCHHCLCKSC